MTADFRLVSFLWAWHGLSSPGAGMEALRRAVAQLQGSAVPASDLEASILPARVTDYSPLQLDELLHAGEVLWQGNRPLGERDGSISLYRADKFPLLGRIGVFAEGARAQLLRQVLLEAPRVPFEDIVERVGGFPEDILRTLWDLVWAGEATSDSLNALRARLTASPKRHHRRPRPRYADRRRLPPGAAGRWRLLTGPRTGFAPESERRLATARQLLDRLGIVCRDTLGEAAADFPSVIAPLEESAAGGLAERVRLLDTAESSKQFAAPGAASVWREAVARPPSGVLAAADPANPFGSMLAWPAMAGQLKPQRAAGARVVFVEGELAGYLTRSGRDLYTPRTLSDLESVVGLLAAQGSGPLFLRSVNGERPYETPWHRHLVAAGFSPSSQGYLLRRGA